MKHKLRNYLIKIYVSPVTLKKKNDTLVFNVMRSQDILDRLRIF